MQPLVGIRGWAERETALEEILSTEIGYADIIHNRSLYHLARIYDTLLQIASGLGVKGEQT